MFILLSLFGLVISANYTYYNDYRQSIDSLAVTFIPQGCEPQLVFVDYGSNITFSCNKTLSPTDNFNFCGSTSQFPYFTTPICYVDDYHAPFTNISVC